MKHFIAIASMLVFATTGSAVDDADVLSSPEEELGRANTHLVNIQNRLKAATEVPRRLGLGSQTVMAERTIANAREFFRHLEFLSTIREVNIYLDLTQVPVAEPHLEAQYMLGRSYEEVGFPSKALRAYFRYLQVFITAETKNYGEMLDVMRRMLPLAASQQESSTRLNSLLSSLTNVEVPDHIGANVFYFAAKAANNSGQRKIANQWLEKSLATGDTPTVQARSLYLRALLQLANKNYAEAEETLGKIMMVEDANGVTEDATKDLARLAMARIAIHRKRPKTALKYYAKILDKSPSFRDATFESVYVHLDVGETKAARTKAMVYLAKFPESKGAFQMRSLLAYLDLRAGNIDTAAAGIKATDGKLTSIDSWMQSSLGSKERVTHEDMVQLMAVTNKYIAPTRSASEAFQLFQRLAELKRRLSDTRGEVRGMIYTAGRIGLSQLRPDWVNRAEQLAQISNDLMRVGHRIAATERNMYANQLSAVDQAKLNASESRRTKLLTKPASMRRQMQHWASLATFLDLTQTIAKQSDKLGKAEAELASARYLLQTSNEKDKAAHANRVKSLSEQARKIDDLLGRTLEVLRRGKAEDYIRQSPHRAVHKFLSQYAVALNEEASILEKIREMPEGTSDRIMAQDAHAAWKHWKFLARETYAALKELDSDIKEGITSLFADLETHDKKFQELSEQLRVINAGLEAELGSSVTVLLSQYSGAIGKRLSRHQKWRADLDWLGYTKARQDSNNAAKKYNLEKQMLQENLSDLEQGAMWSWPE